jgi:hypothetical protein
VAAPRAAETRTVVAVVAVVAVVSLIVLELIDNETEIAIMFHQMGPAI